MQINRLGSLPQKITIGWAQNNAATGGQHTSTTLGQLVNHLFFKIAKSRLTFALEKLADGATNALLYDLIRIEKPDI